MFKVYLACQTIDVTYITKAICFVVYKQVFHGQSTI